MSRYKDLYKNEIVDAMTKKFGYKNVMEVPKLDKIVINMAVGEAKENAKLLENAANDMAIISGQKPVYTKAKKSIANFKLREGMPIGCKVTLRGDKMYDFLDRLVNLALPRVRDFRGINPNSFDGRGNYALGIKEQLIFPEIEYEKTQTEVALTPHFPYLFLNIHFLLYNSISMQCPTDIPLPLASHMQFQENEPFLYPTHAPYLLRYSTELIRLPYATDHTTRTAPLAGTS